MLANDQYHNVFHLREDHTDIPLTDVIEIHFIISERKDLIKLGGVNEARTGTGLEKSHGCIGVSELGWASTSTIYRPSEISMG